MTHLRALCALRRYGNLRGHELLILPRDGGLPRCASCWQRVDPATRRTA
ncbi:hypothetical protein [Miltoncostaea marina]|nr:hypothetical protein [Miltoncostaea marina]